MPHSRRPIYIYAFACYAALACALTYPLVRHLSSTIPHDLGDPLLSTTILWWNAHTLPLTDRWWDGFAFYPAHGMLAFSDHRLGESLLATPLQWLGASPLTAYNVTLLATFPLCAIAAHWLAFTLTKRHDASAIGGLAYGFCPYRIAHLPHLELLAAFGMPAALAALHQYKDTGRRRWLAVFTAALVVQGLCCSYYLLFFSVLLGLWLLWFTHRDDVRPFVGILVAGACAVVALLPVAIGYSRIHAYYGLSRPFYEILRLSADATSYLTAHETLRFWGWTARWAKSEGELFPGATIALLALAGAVVSWRRDGTRDRIDRLSLWLLLVAAVYAAIAFFGWAYAPWRVAFAGVTISSEAPFKSMTVSLLAIAIWLGASSKLRDAYARRSAFAFYAIATVILALCSLGPKPTVTGHQFLYEPPYAWLMRFPIFDAIRVPARFGLPVMLALATTGALAFNRLRLTTRARHVLAAVLLIGIIADGWIKPLTLPTMPDTWAASRADGFTAVLELPLGELHDDIPAMFRVMTHGHPVVNGSSGFEPTHYFTLKVALEERDPAALDGFPPGQRLLIVVDKQKDPERRWQQFLQSLAHVTPVADEPRWAFFAAETQPEPPVCDGRPVPIAGISTNDPPATLGLLTDHDPKTFWATSHFQRLGDELILDLGTQVHPCAVAVSVGEFRVSYPRKLAVGTSLTGEEWTTVAVQRTAGLTMRGALNNPKTVSIVIPLAASVGRFVRLRVEESHPKIAWLVTDVAVMAAAERE
jgi:hypothetical protein